MGRYNLLSFLSHPFVQGFHFRWTILLCHANPFLSKFQQLDDIVPLHSSILTWRNFVDREKAVTV